MTLVLKSNVKMNTGNLKSKIGLEPVVAADFVGETYLVDGQNVGINDVVSVSNNRLAGKLDAFGNYSEATASKVPVLAFDPVRLKKGLQVDSPAENFFVSAKSPKSFSRQLVINTASVLVLKVVGAGSATLTVAGVNAGIATENNPVIYKTQTTDTVTVSVDVSGSISFGGLYRVLDARPFVGRYEDGSTAAKDIVSVSSNALSKLTNMTGCIVIKNALKSQIFDRSLTKSETYLLAQIIDSTAGSQSKGFSVAFKENHNDTYAFRGYDSAEKIVSIANANARNANNTIAVNFSKTKITVAINGELLGSLQLSAVNVDTINIASGHWGSTTPQLIESYMLYNRELTNDELIAVTK